jgi:hypothetical protein
VWALAGDFRRRLRLHDLPGERLTDERLHD